MFSTERVCWAASRLFVVYSILRAILSLETVNTAVALLHKPDVIREKRASAGYVS